MNAAKCPSCGAPLGAGALAGQCPRCLLAGNSRARTTEDVGAQREAAAVAVLPTGAASLPDADADAGSPPPPLKAPIHGRTDALDDEELHPRPDPVPHHEHAATWSDRAPAPQIEGYDVLRELKLGGQGVVYLAVQRSTKRKVAVKVLLEGMFASKSARRRFEREIELVVSLKHPNIIAVFDSGTTVDGHDYYVMDYVRGVPLTQHVREKGLGLDQMLALFATTCEAVNHAHLRGVIHRDLKPSNILVDAEGNVRVLDFGLAKALIEPAESIVSVTGNVVGTFPYMSPEQTRANPDEMDTRTDVYALGVVLYEALTGKHPYPVTGTVADIVRHIVETPPAPPSRSWTEATGVRAGAGRRRRRRCPIDADLETILLKALSKERERRYDNAGHFARDVRRYLADEPIVARRPSTAYQLRRFAKRNKPLVFGSLGIALALVLGLATTTWQAITATRMRNELAAANAKAERAQLQAEDSLASGLAWWGARLEASDDFLAAWKAYGQALDGANKFGNTRQMPILSGVLQLSHRVQVPVVGPFGQGGGVGGFAGYDKEVNGVVVCRDGRSAVACGEDGRVIRWDLRTGTALRAYTRPGDDRDAQSRGVNLLALSPDGRRLLGSGDDGTATLWDVDSGEVLKTLDSEAREGQTPRGTWAVAFSPDGRYALTGGDEFVDHTDDAVLRLWDLTLPRRNLVKSDSAVFESPEPHTGPVPGIAFRDAQTAVTASHDGTIKIWDLPTLRLKGTLKPDDEPDVRREINDVVVLADGRHAVSASFGGYVGLWDLETGRLEHKFTGHKGSVWRVAASSDGRTIASAGADGTTRLWDVARLGQVKVLYGHFDQVMDVDFSPDGAVVVSGGMDRVLAAWTVPAAVPVGNRAGVIAAERHAKVPCVSVSDGPDRVILAGSEDGGVTLWDAATGRLLRTWRVHGSAVRAVRISPDGARATSVGADGSVASWDVYANSAPVMQPGAGPVDCAAFYPDGQSLLLLASGAVNGLAVAGGKPLHVAQWPGGSATALAVSADGKTGLAVMSNGRVRQWDLGSGTELRPHMPTLTSTVAAVSPDGKTVVSDGEDADVRVWELGSEDPPRRLEGHRGHVTAVAFSSDSGCAASGADDGTVRAWNFREAARYHEFETSLSRTDFKAPAPAALAEQFGRWHAFRGKDDWAAQLLERARDGKVPVNPLLLGQCYWRLGDLKSARAQYDQAIREGKGNLPYLRLCLQALGPSPGGEPQPSVR